LDAVILWQEYVKGKQTYLQLALKYDCSVKTIQRKLDAYTILHIALIGVMDILEAEKRTTVSNGHFGGCFF
jgi:hypothetical protein